MSLRQMANHCTTARDTIRLLQGLHQLSHLFPLLPTLCAANEDSFFSRALFAKSKASYVSRFFSWALMLVSNDRSRDARAKRHRNSASSLKSRAEIHQQSFMCKRCPPKSLALLTLEIKPYLAKQMTPLLSCFYRVSWPY